MPFGALFNHCASIRSWARAVVRIPIFRVYARSLLRDLRRSEFTRFRNESVIHVIRILHGKRDIMRVLGREPAI